MNTDRATGLVTFRSASRETTVHFEDLFRLLVDHATRNPRIDRSVVQEVKDRNGRWLYWGDYLGFDARGKFQVWTPKEGTIFLDPATGRRVRR